MSEKSRNEVTFDLCLLQQAHEAPLERVRESPHHEACSQSNLNLRNWFNEKAFSAQIMGNQQNLPQDGHEEKKTNNELSNV
jgi:hypothetical protein